IADWRTAGWRCKLGLELAGSTATTAPRTAWAARTWATSFASQLVAAMFAAGRPAAVAVELTVGIQIVGFEIAIDAFTPGACGPSSRGGLDHDERCVLLLRNLRRRQPSLLPRG